MNYICKLQKLDFAIKPATSKNSIIYYILEIPIKAFHSNNGVKGYFSFQGGFIMVENQRKQPANIIRDFIGDSDRERFVVLGMSTKNEQQVLQVVHTGSINASIVHSRNVIKALVLANCACCVIGHNHPSNSL